MLRPIGRLAVILLCLAPACDQAPTPPLRTSADATKAAKIAPDNTGSGEKSAGVKAATNGPAKTAPRLSKEKAIVLANVEAKKRRIDLKDYEPPRVEYEFTEQGGSWTVFYERKVKAPGQFFGIRVDDQTGECKLLPGM